MIFLDKLANYSPIFLKIFSFGENLERKIHIFLMIFISIIVWCESAYTGKIMGKYFLEMRIFLVKMGKYFTDFYQCSSTLSCQIRVPARLFILVETARQIGLIRNGTFIVLRHMSDLHEMF